MTESNTLRRGELDTLTTMLRTQHDLKYDVVVPASKLTMVDGKLAVADGAIEFHEDGLSNVDAFLDPTASCQGNIASRFDIPVKYLRRMAVEQPELLDTNVNTWLAAQPERKFLVRGFLGSGETEGMGRAMLSDRYKMIDNLDVLMASLDGIAKSGVRCEIESVDLDDKHMRVRVKSPDVAIHAPTLLRGYRSPFANGNHGGAAAQNPETVWGGFEITNSETGHGAMAITPRIHILVCDNGMMVKKDVLRSVHAGAKLAEGQIEWSHQTQQLNVDLVASQVKDAVSSFLDPAYVEGIIRGLESEGDVELPVGKEQDIIRQVTKLNYSDEEQDSILSMFTRSGDTRAMGVMQAVTAAAQVVATGERQAEMESDAFNILSDAARLARV